MRFGRDPGGVAGDPAQPLRRGHLGIGLLRPIRGVPGVEELEHAAAEIGRSYTPWTASAGEASADAAHSLLLEKEGREDGQVPPDLTAAAFFDVDNTMVQGASIVHFARGLAARKYFTYGDIMDFAWTQAKFRITGKENARDVERCQWIVADTDTQQEQQQHQCESGECHRDHAGTHHPRRRTDADDEVSAFESRCGRGLGLGLGRHTFVSFCRRTMAIRNGAPTIARTTPTWTSPGRAMTRPMTSQTSMSVAPMSAE